MSYQLIFQYNLQCPPPNPSHCEGFCNVPFLSVLRSGLLTFFSSLVIQESLINCVGERRRSGITSHCEVIPGFCLSPSYPEVELGLTGPTSISTNIRTTCSKSLAVFVSNGSSLSVRPCFLKLNSPSQKWRAFPEISARLFQPLTVFRSNVPFLNAMARILKLNSGSQGRRPFQQTSARLVPSPLRCLFPMIRP